MAAQRESFTPSWGGSQEGFLQKDTSKLSSEINQISQLRAEGYGEQDPVSLPPQALRVPHSYKGWESFLPTLC